MPPRVKHLHAEVAEGHTPNGAVLTLNQFLIGSFPGRLGILGNILHNSSHRFLKMVKYEVGRVKQDNIGMGVKEPNTGLNSTKTSETEGCFLPVPVQRNLIHPFEHTVECCLAICA